MAKTMSPLQVGNAVLLKTVTDYYTGRIVEVSDAEIVLELAAWIANTGRFSDALAKGTLQEVEPIPPIGGMTGGTGIASISRGALVAAFNWTNPLPRNQV